LAFSHSLSIRVFSSSPPSSSASSLTHLQQANIHDIWWEQRQDIDRLRMLGEHPPNDDLTRRTQTTTLETLPLDKVHLAQALTEFVESDFVRTMFVYFDVQEVTSYGTLRGVFESVEFNDNGRTITLRLNRSFDAKKAQLLDRLSKYLRARLDRRVQIHALHRDGRDIW